MGLYGTVRTVPVEAWEEVDSHTGCSKPLPPSGTNPIEPIRIPWANIGNAIKDAAEAVLVTAPDFVIDRASTYALVVSPTNYRTVYFLVCVPEGELASRLAEIEVSRRLATATAESAATLKKLRKAAAFSGVLVSLAVADYLFCEHAVDPF